MFQAATDNLCQRPFALFGDRLRPVVELVWQLDLRLDHDGILPSLTSMSTNRKHGRGLFGIIEN
jgi:hypothetical protein